MCVATTTAVSLKQLEFFDVGLFKRGGAMETLPPDLILKIMALLGDSLLVTIGTVCLVCKDWKRCMNSERVLLAIAKEIGIEVGNNTDKKSIRKLIVKTVGGAYLTREPPVIAPWTGTSLLVVEGPLFILTGDGGVGKSAIAIRFVSGTFVGDYDPTIEDTYRKAIEWGKQVLYLNILDEAGQEEFTALRSGNPKR